jgi:hypothetical protein
MQRPRCLLEPNHNLSQLIGNRQQVGIAINGRTNGAFRLPGKPKRTRSIVGRQQRRSRPRTIGQHVGVTQPLPLGLERIVFACQGLDSGNPLGNPLELGDPASQASRLDLCRLTCRARCHQIAPRRRHRAEPSVLLLTPEGIQDGTLRSRLRETSRLVLRDHANHATTRLFQGATRGTAPTDQRPATSVATNTAGHEQAIIDVVDQLADPRKSRVGEDRLINSKICLDVDLITMRTNEASLTLRTKHKPECTCEDRLARPGLTRDDRHAGRRLNFRRAEHDEVIDAKPLQHGQWPNLSR